MGGVTEQSVSDAKVKGLIFLGARRWMTATYGEDGFRSFLAKLSDEDRAPWTSGIILPVSWLPARAYVSMYEAQEALWGSGDGRHFQRAAAAVAFDDLSTVMKVFMKMGSPAFVAKRFPMAWDRYFDTGAFRLLEQGTNTLEASLEGARAYGEAGCAGTIGWSRQALEYAGAKGLHVEHPECAFAGGSRCLLRFSWS